MLHLYDIPGYIFLNTNRKNKVGGGVGIYIKDHINFKIREDLSTNKEDILESLFIECKTNNKADSIIVGVKKKTGVLFTKHLMLMKKLRHSTA